MNKVNSYKKALTIRPYRNGDEVKIVDLFEKAFGKTMSLAHWFWRFRDNPSPEIMVDLAWDGEVLAGHYSVSPVVISIFGIEYISGLSLTAMTRPEYQRLGLFVTLAESVHSRMLGKEMPMVWAFPNRLSSHRGFVRNLSWVDIHGLTTFFKVLKDKKQIPEPSAHVYKVSEFDDRFDRLWDEIKVNYNIIVKRDSSYLSWRYNKNPLNDYTVFGCFKDEKLRGYVICKQYLGDVDIVDILFVDTMIGCDLVCAVVKWAERKGAEKINMWLNVNLPLHRELEKFGFTNENAESITYLSARTILPDLDEKDIYNFKNWYITMGDSDVY